MQSRIHENKKLGYRRGTVRHVMLVSLVNCCVTVRKIPFENACNMWMTGRSLELIKIAAVWYATITTY